MYHRRARDKEDSVFAQYLSAALRGAEYEDIEDDGTVFATIPGFDGLWANAPTRSSARKELFSVLEGWVLLGLAHHHHIPVVDGIDLNVRQVA